MKFMTGLLFSLLLTGFIAYHLPKIGAWLAFAIIGGAVLTLTVLSLYALSPVFGDMAHTLIDKIQTAIGAE